VRVLQEWTLVGRLFQRKPRAPNEMLQRVTDRSLAEADLRVSDLVQLYTPCRNMECTAGPDHLDYRYILLYESITTRVRVF